MVALPFVAVGSVLAFVCARLIFGGHKPNRYFGHRNKWTLTDREVWDKTHKMTGYLILPLAVLLFIAAFLSAEAELLGLYLPYLLLAVMVYLMLASIAIEMYSRKIYLSKHGHLNVSAAQFRKFEETMIIQEEHIMLGVSSGAALGLLLGNLFVQFWLGFFLGMIAGFAAGVSPAYLRR